jgi:CheY-like chemotaxis protein
LSAGEVLSLHINKEEERIMSTPVKVVCPKCKARLKIAADKIVSEIVKFKCPGCQTVLRIKKPPPHYGEMGPVADYHAKEQATQPQTTADAFVERGEEDAVSDPEEKTGSDSGDTRQFKRVKFKKKVLVDNQIMVEALDISEKGLFLHTGRSFDIGAIIEVAIPTAPGNFDLKVQAKVQHNHRGIGMGLMFVNLDDVLSAKLQHLVNSLDATAQQELEGRMKILLAGGSDTARNIIKSKLVLDGFYVMQATSVEEVNRILQHEQPDAIVMDWQATAFNCKGLFYQIKEKHQYDDIVIVVLSTLTDAAVQKEIIDAGADRYMTKMDASPLKLSMTLKKLIEERKG